MFSRFLARPLRRTCCRGAPVSAVLQCTVRMVAQSPGCDTRPESRASLRPEPDPSSPANSLGCVGYPPSSPRLIFMPSCCRLMLQAARVRCGQPTRAWRVVRVDCAG
ncbi:hypothetical protein F443_05428 [Phytophthora nicotianae P1569]|uniref:Uncharacterized protein n=2 Tax=Phytophthora nicotianae TaxID=4792 RepID=V9FIE4_PHYNI|nr:hypothetical protein F443_05428 [Phytophthora nicotianae P1569]ETO79971.1 hypothetical protein F444_05473 [Phytophthora nicotianae P1976]